MALLCLAVPALAAPSEETLGVTVLRGSSAPPPPPEAPPPAAPVQVPVQVIVQYRDVLYPPLYYIALPQLEMRRHR